MNQYRLLHQNDFSTSSWSGGTTTELFLWPPDASYAQKNFLWRLSSATIDLETSEFTLLPQYNRILTVLNGSLAIRTSNQAPVILRPFEQYAFDGAAQTISRGKAVDFNLMMRKDLVHGSIKILTLESGEQMILRELLPADHTHHTKLLYVLNGTVRIFVDEEYRNLIKPKDLLSIFMDKNRANHQLRMKNKSNVPVHVIITDVWSENIKVENQEP